MNTYIIVPCYNEELRLNVSKFLEYSNLKHRFIFANDGSTDNTIGLLNELKKSDPNRFLVYNATDNAGKGAVVRNAFLHFDKEGQFEQGDWIGYWDADLATPLVEISSMLSYAKLYDLKINSIWGSRLLRLGSHIERRPHRHILGRLFALLINLVFRVNCYDTQCGAKLFDLATAQVAFGEPFSTNWIFDVEILLRVRSANIIEYPLMYWEDVDGSKISVIRELPRVLKDIFSIWKNK